MYLWRHARKLHAFETPSRGAAGAACLEDLSPFRNRRRRARSPGASTADLEESRWTSRLLGQGAKARASVEDQARVRAERGVLPRGACVGSPARATGHPRGRGDGRRISNRTPRTRGTASPARIDVCGRRGVTVARGGVLDGHAAAGCGDEREGECETGHWVPPSMYSQSLPL